MISEIFTGLWCSNTTVMVATYHPKDKGEEFVQTHPQMDKGGRAVKKGSGRGLGFSGKTLPRGEESTYKAPFV